MKTRFLIFTTTLLADIVSQGIVTLSHPIEKYLPSTRKLNIDSEFRLPFELRKGVRDYKM